MVVQETRCLTVFTTVRVLQLVKRAAAAFRVNDWTLNQIDPDGLRHVATMSVRGHWFVIAVLLFELVYRPYLYFGVPRYATYALLHPGVDRIQRVHSLPSPIEPADYMALAG